VQEAEQRNAEMNAFQKYTLRQDLYNMCVANLQLKSLSPGERLDRLLCELAAVLGARRAAGSVQFVLPLDNLEMAELLALSESHYKQIRTDLERAGRLRRKQRRVIILTGCD
jgi:Crp-like helix-turn-helix domain